MGSGTSKQRILAEPQSIETSLASLAGHVDSLSSLSSEDLSPTTQAESTRFGEGRDDDAIGYFPVPVEQHFVFMKSLGRGTFGEVSLAQDRATKKMYAIKTFHKPASPYFRKSDFSRAEVKNEARIMERLRHTQLVRLYAVYEDVFSYSFVLEFCAGGDLRQVMRGRERAARSTTLFNSPQVDTNTQTKLGGLGLTNQQNADAGNTAALLSKRQRSKSQDVQGGLLKLPSVQHPFAVVRDSPNPSPSRPQQNASCKQARNSLAGPLGQSYYLTEAEAASVLCDVLAALDYMHSRRIVHRDVKVDNIFLRFEHVRGSSLAENDFLLGDFGFSAILNTEDGLLHSMCGSPVYMAPEVVGRKGASSKQEAEAMGERSYGPKSDIWSTGVALHFLLTGVFPFFGRTTSDTFYRIVHHPFRASSSSLGTLSGKCVRLLSRMLDKDPARRPSARNILLIDPWLQSLASKKLERHSLGLRK